MTGLLINYLKFVNKQTQQQIQWNLLLDNYARQSGETTTTQGEHFQLFPFIWSQAIYIIQIPLYILSSINVEGSIYTTLYTLQLYIVCLVTSYYVSYKQFTHLQGALIRQQFHRHQYYKTHTTQLTLQLELQQYGKQPRIRHNSFLQVILLVPISINYLSCGTETISENLLTTKVLIAIKTMRIQL